RARGGGSRLPAERHGSGKIGGRRTPGAERVARHRSGTCCGGLGRAGSADRTRKASPPPGGRRNGKPRYRGEAKPIGRNGAKLSFGGDQQAGRSQPRRSSKDCKNQGLAVAATGMPA